MYVYTRLHAYTLPLLGRQFVVVHVRVHPQLGEAAPHHRAESPLVEHQAAPEGVVGLM